MDLSYAHLNFRFNPFGELTADERASLSVVDVREVVQLLTSGPWVVQFVGNKGFGKTTHLTAICREIPGARYVHIPEGQRRPIPNGDVIVIDEAQRLTWRQRRLLLKDSRPLVLGTHRDFQPAFERVGRNVRTFDASHSTGLARLRQIVDRRIEFARRSSGAVPVVSDRSLRILLQRHGQDVRSMLLSLYDEVQRLPCVTEIRIN